MQLKSAIAGLLALGAMGDCQLTQVRDFNAGPTRLGMYIKVGRNLKTPAPIIVAVHHCQGSATGYSGATKYPALADQHGFIVIYPNSKSGGGCFDVASTASMLSPAPESHLFFVPHMSLTTVSFSAHPQRRRRQPNHRQHGQIRH
jgi:poly(3-hydroxybutyrate) depolymerase